MLKRNEVKREKEEYERNERTVTRNKCRKRLYCRNDKKAKHQGYRGNNWVRLMPNERHRKQS
jgi:hypothetical protein